MVAGSGTGVLLEPVTHTINAGDDNEEVLNRL